MLWFVAKQLALSWQVKKPNATQRRATKMGADTDTDKLFLVYFKTQEFEALPMKQVMRWGSHKASLDDLEGYPQLWNAVHLAKQAIRDHAQQLKPCIPRRKFGHVQIKPTSVLDIL